MSPVLYIVTATLPDEPCASEYVDWLESGHLREVVALGKARWGRIARVLEPASPIRVESHYLFESRADFDTYVRMHANRLRAEGIQRFPADRGLSFERRVCEVRGSVAAPGFRVD